MKEQMQSLIQSGLAQRVMKRDLLRSGLTNGGVCWSMTWAISDSLLTSFLLLQMKLRFLGSLSLYRPSMSGQCGAEDRRMGRREIHNISPSFSVSCGASASNCIPSRILITSKKSLPQWSHLSQSRLQALSGRLQMLLVADFLFLSLQRWLWL